MQRGSVFTLKDYGIDFSITLNGNTAVLDFPGECWDDGAKVVYQKMLDGIWEVMSDGRCFAEGEVEDAIEGPSSGSVADSCVSWLAVLLSSYLAFFL